MSAPKKVRALATSPVGVMRKGSNHGSIVVGRFPMAVVYPRHWCKDSRRHFRRYVRDNGLIAKCVETIDGSPEGEGTAYEVYATTGAALAAFCEMEFIERWHFAERARASGRSGGSGEAYERGSRQEVELRKPVSHLRRYSDVPTYQADSKPADKPVMNDVPMSFAASQAGLFAALLALVKAGLLGEDTAGRIADAAKGEDGRAIADGIVHMVASGQLSDLQAWRFLDSLAAE